MTRNQRLELKRHLVWLRASIRRRQQAARELHRLLARHSARKRK